MIRATLFDYTEPFLAVPAVPRILLFCGGMGGRWMREQGDGYDLGEHDSAGVHAGLAPDHGLRGLPPGLLARRARKVSFTGLVQIARRGPAF